MARAIACQSRIALASRIYLSRPPRIYAILAAVKTILCCQFVHYLRVDQNWVIDSISGKLVARTDVFWFQEVIILEDFSLGRAASQHVEHVFNTNAIVADAGPSSALLGVKRDAIRVLHGYSIIVPDNRLKHITDGTVEGLLAGDQGAGQPVLLLYLPIAKNFKKAVDGVLGGV
jgi:hypothetical protein